MLSPRKGTIEPDVESLERKECAFLGRELCEGGLYSWEVRRQQ
jgi:hypothetical protein